MIIYLKVAERHQTVICHYDCNYCTHSINFFKLTNVMSCKRQYPLVVRHVTAFLQQSKTGAQWSSSKNRQEVISDIGTNAFLFQISVSHFELVSIFYYRAESKQVVWVKQVV